VKTSKKISTIGYAEADLSYTNCVRVGDHLLPKRIDVVLPGAGGQPRLTARLELVDKVPQCREITFASPDAGREVRQTDLRSVSIADMVEGVYAGFARKITRVEDGVITAVEEAGEIAYIDAIRDIANARKGKGARKVTPEFLAEVAEVYRQHIDDRPTSAVQRAFTVGPSMAADYVSRARQAGLLPPTTPGKKKA
jgi:hypothetical protein